MKVATNEPFQLIYSLFEHEYLGYLFETYVVQLNEHGELTFSHQNISPKNAMEFKEGLDEVDFELINIIEEMQQESIIKHFYKKKIKPIDFFLKMYDPEKGNKDLQYQIEVYLERRRSMVLSRIQGRMLYEMGSDGEPAWKRIHIPENKATVLFHFRRNDQSTLYFPTIKHDGQKVEFQGKSSYIICNDPAYMVVEDTLYCFEKEVDGKKLSPFLKKKFIIIPKKMEETYYEKFVSQLVASFDVYAKGFEIKTEHYPPEPILKISELQAARTASLFDDNGGAAVEDEGKILFELKFNYGPYSFSPANLSGTSVSLSKEGDQYTFIKINRQQAREKEYLSLLGTKGLLLKGAKTSLPKSVAFDWINSNKELLEQLEISLTQTDRNGKRYFIGESRIELEVRENIDWFDIDANVWFGDFKIAFKEIRNLIIRKKREFTLPNGEIAVIPEVWFTEYSELFSFIEEHNDSANDVRLQKHHLSLLQELESNNLATVQISNKLEKLRNFQEIEDFRVPAGFGGELRPYQKAGFNWMHFLSSYNFGGCLADDMGLGKTVQTLAMLQSQKELLQEKGEEQRTSLLVMPTSLIYNWQMEAQRFTPKLKVHVYTGTNRDKNISRFKNYDLILTSYGITRLDIDLFAEFRFHYVILDESQAIKNPGSNIAKAVRKLNSNHRLILTGTPLENSTLDLWSQMNFINPGLLGNQTFFKKEFQLPIEKNGDEKQTQKLYSIIKPFILRRHKSQVATELPEKVENVHYCNMTTEQEERYEEAKSYYRNKIMESIESNGVNKSHLILLKGLTALRQIANHPRMVDQEYEADSGKLNDVVHMLDTAISKDHNILIFSQFVKHLSIIREHLDNEGIDYAYLDGSTKDRVGQVNKFQQNEKVRVFLISLKAGGLGLNLTKADYVFLLDPWWNPAIEQQAVDRAHRIGQENKVFTYKFITKNSVEEKILKLQNNKMKLAQDLITVEESFVKNLSTEDIQALLD